jgi:hypothetical protein
MGMARRHRGLGRQVTSDMTGWAFDDFDRFDRQISGHNPRAPSYAQRLDGIKPIKPIKDKSMQERETLMSDFPEMEYETKEAELELGPNGTSLDFLRKVYRTSRQPLSVDAGAAIALPFESPKLSAIAVLNGGDFSERLERAIARSGREPKLIDQLNE